MRIDTRGIFDFNAEQVSIRPQESMILPPRKEQQLSTPLDPLSELGKSHIIFWSRWKIPKHECSVVGQNVFPIAGPQIRPYHVGGHIHIPRQPSSDSEWVTGVNERSQTFGHL